MSDRSWPRRLAQHLGGSRPAPPPWRPLRLEGLEERCTPATVPWVVVAPDDGAPPNVRVYSPTGALIKQVDAFGLSYTRGVHVALGDITGDGVPEIFAATGLGGAPIVNIYNGQTL